MPAGTRNIRTVRNCRDVAVCVLDLQEGDIFPPFRNRRKNVPLPPWNNSSSSLSCTINELLPSCRPFPKTSSGTTEHLWRHDMLTLAEGLSKAFCSENGTPEISQEATGWEIPSVPGEEGMCQFLITGLEQTEHLANSSHRMNLLFTIRDLLTCLICNFGSGSVMLVDRLLFSVQVGRYQT